MLPKQVKVNAICSSSSISKKCRSYLTAGGGGDGLVLGGKVPVLGEALAAEELGGFCVRGGGAPVSFAVCASSWGWRPVLAFSLEHTPTALTY